MSPQDHCFPAGYQALRPLSFTSPVFLCRENASDRLCVIKFTPKSREAIFRKEVQALAELAEFAPAPRLYFAATAGEWSYAGLEYRHGRSLLEQKGKLEALALSGVEKALRLCIESLHARWGIAHGDLSPKNILVHPAEKESMPWRITLVDWEFSEKVKEQSLRTYSAYRGTPGFSEPGEARDPFLKDWQAFEACLKFMGSGRSENRGPAPSKRKPRKWLDWI